MSVFYAPAQARLIDIERDDPPPDGMRLNTPAAWFPTSGSSGMGVGEATGCWRRGKRARRPLKAKKPRAVPGLCDSDRGWLRSSRRRGARPRRFALLDLRLFVADVLADDGVELAHFQLIRMQTLVLRGHVEVAGSGRGQQLDFFRA